MCKLGLLLCCCRGWCELCCGRGCGFCIGPIRRYQEAFASGRWLPTLQVSNYMNHEAILQVSPHPPETPFGCCRETLDMLDPS